MTEAENGFAGAPVGLPGDLHEAGNRVARKAWRALRRRSGMRLSFEEVQALHAIECDGDWWQSFSPAHLSGESKP